MTESLRTLLYPFGFVASFFFTVRFFIQWILSEIKHESHVTDLFWRLSVVGNIFLMVHSLIQVQFHLCAIQACNVIISWRNLNLMKARPAKFSTVIGLVIAMLSAVTILFILQGVFWLDSIQWVRTPTMPWGGGGGGLSLPWHIMGFFGMILFASRFWVQWIYAEKSQKSLLGKSFWWLSLIGAFLAVIYFIFLGDVVNIIGYGLGIIPYLRNLILIGRYGQRV